MPRAEGDVAPESVREAVRRQLQRLLASKNLVNSAHLSRFLRHVVERTLAGETDSLKEYVLGTEVFERGDRFDPRTDPVVRVEARRLRSKLEDYYATDGAADQLLIRLPKGGYVPVFESRGGVEGMAAEAAAVDRVLWRPYWRRVRLMAAAMLPLAAIAGLGWMLLKSPNPSPKSIVALRFVALESDPDTEYLADGLTNELIDILGRTDGLRVVARSLVSQFKTGAGDAAEIARRLHADILLQGTVRKHGQQLRVSAQLVDASTGFELWSQTFEREWTRVFTLQRDIASSIATALKVRPDAEPASRRTRNPESYNLYLKGRHYWSKRTVPDLEAAIAAFRQAIDKDPDYALAWAGLADSYSMLGFMNALPPMEIREKAEEAAGRALALDETLAEAHVAQGNVQGTYNWDWAGCERSFRRAAELDPSSALAHYGLSKTLASTGRLDAALPEMRRARDLDPLSLVINGSLAWELGAARRYGESDEAFRATVELDANFPWTYTLHAWSYEARGEFDKAIAELNSAVRLSGSSSLALGELAHALGRSGKPEEGARILDRLLKDAKKHYVSAFDLSRAYEGLGRHDDAMAELSKACDEHAPIVVFLRADHVFDPLRSDPRFGVLLKRMRLE